MPPPRGHSRQAPVEEYEGLGATAKTKPKPTAAKSLSRPPQRRRGHFTVALEEGGAPQSRKRAPQSRKKSLSPPIMSDRSPTSDEEHSALAEQFRTEVAESALNYGASKSEGAPQPAPQSRKKKRRSTSVHVTTKAAATSVQVKTEAPESTEATESTSVHVTTKAAATSVQVKTEAPDGEHSQGADYSVPVEVKTEVSSSSGSGHDPVEVKIEASCGSGHTRFRVLVEGSSGSASPSPVVKRRNIFKESMQPFANDQRCFERCSPTQGTIAMRAEQGGGVGMTIDSGYLSHVSDDEYCSVDFPAVAGDRQHSAYSQRSKTKACHWSTPTMSLKISYLTEACDPAELLINLKTDRTHVHVMILQCDDSESWLFWVFRHIIELAAADPTVEGSSMDHAVAGEWSQFTKNLLPSLEAISREKRIEMLSRGVFVLMRREQIDGFEWRKAFRVKSQEPDVSDCTFDILKVHLCRLQDMWFTFAICRSDLRMTRWCTESQVAAELSQSVVQIVDHLQRDWQEEDVRMLVGCFGTFNKELCDLLTKTNAQVGHAMCPRFVVATAEIAAVAESSAVAEGRLIQQFPLGYFWWGPHRKVKEVPEDDAVLSEWQSLRSLHRAVIDHEHFEPQEVKSLKDMRRVLEKPLLTAKADRASMLTPFLLDPETVLQWEFMDLQSTDVSDTSRRSGWSSSRLAADDKRFNLGPIKVSSLTKSWEATSHDHQQQALVAASGSGGPASSRDCGFKAWAQQMVGVVSCHCLLGTSIPSKKRRETHGYAHKARSRGAWK